MGYAIIFFHKNDWEIWKKFNTEKEAEEFIENYPIYDADYSKTIRRGNWQIIKLNA